jgi:predicted kinase
LTSALLVHPALIVLIGLPGSGKSFLARQWVAQCQKRRLIATDTIRSQLFGAEAIQGDWLKVQQEVERQFRQVVLEMEQGEVCGAIYDATNAVRNQRHEAIALARTCGFTQIIGLWLDVPLELCLERNQQRDRQVPESVILHMHRSLCDAPPDILDGFDQVIQPLFHLDQAV